MGGIRRTFRKLGRYGLTKTSAWLSHHREVMEVGRGLKLWRAEMLRWGLEFMGGVHGVI